MSSTLHLRFIASLLACLCFGLPVGRAQAGLTSAQPRLVGPYVETHAEVPPWLRAQGISRAPPRSSKSDLVVIGLVVAVLGGLTALSVGAAHSKPHSRMRNPAVFGAAAGGITYLVVGSWAALQGADTGAPLAAFMSALVVGPLAGLIARDAAGSP